MVEDVVMVFMASRFASADLQLARAIELPFQRITESWGMSLATLFPFECHILYAVVGHVLTAFYRLLCIV